MGIKKVDNVDWNRNNILNASILDKVEHRFHLDYLILKSDVHLVNCWPAKIGERQIQF